jgi:hypothetical protein
MKCLLPLVVLLIAAPGCTLSVHPVLNDSNLSKDVDLSGTWEQRPPPKNDPKWKPIIVSCSGYKQNSMYDAVYENTQQEFDLRIGRVGDERILQFIRTDLSLKNDSPVLARLPLFCFAKFKVKENGELHVFPLIHDRDVRKLLDKEKIPYRDYEPSNTLEWCIITATTSQLQEFIRKSGDELFQKEPLIFDRVTSKKKEK